MKISQYNNDTAPLTADYVLGNQASGPSTKTFLISDLISLFGQSITPSGVMTEYGGRTAPSGWLLCYGQTISRTTYANLFSALVPSLGTVTVTIASPGVFTLNGHGLQIGDAVYLTTSGALPTGLTANTIYYVIAAGLTTNNFELSATRGGSAINTSGTQSGTHTLRACPYGLGDGSTTFNVPDMRGRSPSGMDAMGGTAASRVTAAGSGIYGDALGASGGEETHILLTGEMPSHNHGLPNGQQGGTGVNPGNYFSSQYTNTVAGATASATGTNSSGSGNAHNNMEPTLILNYIIKT